MSFFLKRLYHIYPPFWKMFKRTRSWFRRPLLRRRMKIATPVIVLQMGKVASTSIYESLKGYYIGGVFHAHRFERDNLDPNIRMLYRYVFDEERPLKIVSLVREPIGRNVSAFFENYDRIVGEKAHKTSLSLEQMKQAFYTAWTNEEPLNWFDEVIKADFGIDVYSLPFPDSGVRVYSAGRFELLVMKHDLPNSVKEKEIKAFLGIEIFKISEANVGDQKLYFKEYGKFKDEPLSVEYVDRMLSSKYAKHFYPNSRALRLKWLKEGQA